MLRTNPYMVVIALDFSKAFNTVRHSTFAEKLASLDIPDSVYNWVISHLSGHSHKNLLTRDESDFEYITASFIQGSGLGPALYSVEASDLHPVTKGNEMIKFADDTDLVIPARNIASEKSRSTMYSPGLRITTSISTARSHTKLSSRNQKRCKGTTAEEVSRFQRLFPGGVRKSILQPKTHSNIPRDRQLLSIWWLNEIFLKWKHHYD